MGRSLFICVVNTKEQFKEAMRCIFTHNTTPMVETSEKYTDEELRILDPMRFDMLTKLQAEHGALPVTSFRDKWNRGEKIVDGGVFVRFRGDLWLEVKNHGGGICTTLFLKAHAPNLNWIGTEGKPQGFIEAPMVGSASSFQELCALHATLI